MPKKYGRVYNCRAEIYRRNPTACNLSVLGATDTTRQPLVRNSQQAMTDKKLTPKQARFVEEYLIDLNATQAAIRAGYSEKTAEKIGSENIRKPEVKAAIDNAQFKRSQKTKIDANWLLKRLGDEATADVADLYDDDGNILPVKEWPLIWRQGLVAGIDIEIIRADGVAIGEIKKLRVSDRVKRLELIGKHIGVKAFEETVNVKGLDALADRLARAKSRKRDG